MLLFRHAKMSDAKLLFDWRNDPDTRAASHNTGEFDYASHCVWLEKSLLNPERTIYIFEVEDAAHAMTPVGTVRADAASGSITLSWTVAPEHRGKGMGKRIVEEVVHIRNDTDLFAEIKVDNIASQKIAEHAGLKLARHDSHTLFYERKSQSAAG